MNVLSSMSSNSLFDERLVLVGLNGNDSEHVLVALTQLLVQAEYVEPGYVDVVLARENDFPTGLPTEPVPVAIPHGDPDHVIKSGVAVGILSKPIPFKEMGSPTNTLKVKMVFVLAIKETEHQTRILQQFMRIFQKRVVLEQLCRANKPETVVKLLKAEVSESPE